MPERALPPFSKKILLISILFLFVNIAWYALFVFSRPSDDYRHVAPELVSLEEGVQVRTEYSTDYRASEPGHTLVTGTTVKTEKGETAEIILENNIIRIEEDTELVFTENNFSEYIAYEASLPRMKFTLKKGTVWVNAFDGIEIGTERSSVYFSHAVGVITYNSPQTRVMAISGTADISLDNEKGEVLTKFIVPLQNQVTYVNSQIVDEYAILKNSKLKKELKLTSIQGDIMKNEWVVQNTKTDNNILNTKEDFIRTSGEYHFKDIKNKFRYIFTFDSGDRRQLKIERIKFTINYLLGDAIQKSGGEVENVLKNLKEMTVGMENDPDIKKIFTTAFFSIGMVNANTSDYITKEYFIDYLFARDGARVLRSYLTDVTNNIQAGFSESAGKIGAEWLKKWQQGGVLQKNVYEFDLQYQMMKNIIIDHADSVTQKILSIVDEAGEMQIEMYDDKEKEKSDFEEKLFNITQDRLDIVYSLISVYRYTLAKQYLVTSYEPLKIDDFNTRLAAREIFIERSKLLLQRIKFGEEVMNNARQPIDEDDFRDYYQDKVRDDLILDDLKKLLDGKQEPEELIESYSAQDVVAKFAGARISLSSKDITQNEDLAFIFEVKGARLLDRNADNERVSFDATYDINANAVTNVIVNNRLLTGHFILDDLVRELIRKEVVTSDEDKLNENFDELIDPVSDEKYRKMLESQDGARHLVKETLEENAVDIADLKNIKILDTTDLTNFYISQAFVNLNRTSIEIELRYDNILGKASEVKIKTPIEKEIEDDIAIEDLAKTVVDTLEREQENEKLIKKLVDTMSSMRFILNEKNVMISEDYETANFSGLETSGIPLDISGTYNFKEQTFTKLSNDLLTSDGANLLDYAKEAAYLFVIDYLKKEEIRITRDQIQMSHPFTVINIINYPYNKRMLSFVLDIQEGVLRNVTLMDTGEKKDKMTFDEFRLTSPAPTKPKLPGLPAVEEGEPEPESEIMEEETPSLPKLPELP